MEELSTSMGYKNYHSLYSWMRRGKVPRWKMPDISKLLIDDGLVDDK
jgi:hypothetical protein